MAKLDVVFKREIDAELAAIAVTQLFALLLHTRGHFPCDPSALKTWIAWEDAGGKVDEIDDAEGKGKKTFFGATRVVGAGVARRHSSALRKARLSFERWVDIIDAVKTVLETVEESKIPSHVEVGLLLGLGEREQYVVSFDLGTCRTPISRLREDQVQAVRRKVGRTLLQAAGGAPNPSSRREAASGLCLFYKQRKTGRSSRGFGQASVVIRITPSTALTSTPLPHNVTPIDAPCWDWRSKDTRTDQRSLHIYLTSLATPSPSSTPAPTATATAAAAAAASGGGGGGGGGEGGGGDGGEEKDEGGCFAVRVGKSIPGFGLSPAESIRVTTAARDLRTAHKRAEES